MKHLSVLFAALFLQNLPPVNSFGQTGDLNNLLWEISGNGLTKPSYLYGTVHMICEKDFFMKDGLKESFAKTEKLYLEVDMDDPALNMKMLQLAMLQGKKLSDFFTPEDYARLNDFFRDSLKMPLAMLNTMKPFALFSMMLLKAMPCNDHKSYELTFVEMAKAQSKEVLGLETIEDQMKIFDDMPDSVQAQMVMRYVDEFDNQRGEFNKLVENYKKQDVDALYEHIMSSPDIAGAEEALLFGRNRRWIPVIEEAMKNEPVFIAVGAGHLGGEQGVIRLLKEKGYTLSPVK
ncbi:MAG: TraB/GumN family protein [Chitinophagaceae bacterium]|nr:TraB/GumN family protein [Chitinophagaceae bacterium]MCW5929720.1 TraB/GumN family protein [Chitinophagaceae bacterium]